MNYGQFYPNIRPTLGGALEALPSQLQLTISVCLAVRVQIDSLNEGNPFYNQDYHCSASTGLNLFEPYIFRRRNNINIDLYADRSSGG